MRSLELYSLWMRAMQFLARSGLVPTGAFARLWACPLPYRRDACLQASIGLRKLAFIAPVGVVFGVAAAAYLPFSRVGEWVKSALLRTRAGDVIAEPNNVRAATADVFAVPYNVCAATVALKQELSQVTKLFDEFDPSAKGAETLFRRLHARRFNYEMRVVNLHAPRKYHAVCDFLHKQIDDAIAGTNYPEIFDDKDIPRAVERHLSLPAGALSDIEDVLFDLMHNIVMKFELNARLATRSHDVCW